MGECALIMGAAFILDLWLGDPVYAGHPVRLMGHAISFVEKAVRRMGGADRQGGMLMVLAVVCITLGAYLGLKFLFHLIHPLLALSFDVYCAYSFIAFKDLFVHVGKVTQALNENDIAEARRAVQMIVGRDAALLDTGGIVRALVETLSENFIDGFLVPLFWFVTGSIFGYLLSVNPATFAVCFMVIAKTASTLDSMVGYKNQQYETFGTAGARFDDVMAFLPARFSLVFLFFGALPAAGAHPVIGLKTALRDRLKHDSPNAAHGESFMAGALNVRLGGPTQYPGKLKQKPWLGEEFPDPERRHITLAEKVISLSAWIFVLVCLAILIIY